MSPKDFPCPNCGAKAGGWCRRPSGHSGPMIAFHAARVQLAQAAADAEAEELPLEVEEVPAPAFVPPARFPADPPRLELGAQASLFGDAVQAPLGASW